MAYQSGRTLHFVNCNDVQLQIKKPHDWFFVENNKVEQQNGGKYFLEAFKFKPIASIVTQVSADSIFPEGYWSDWSNRRSFIDQISTKLGVTNLDFWYSIKPSFMVSNESSAHAFAYIMNHHYGGDVPSGTDLYDVANLITALKDLYPEYEWKTLLFQWIPSVFWLSKKNQVQYLDEVAKELKFAGLSGWYSVTPGQVQQYRLENIAEQYEGSLISALEALYPTYHWNVSKFHSLPAPRKPVGYWNETRNQRAFFDQLAAKFNIQRPEDWYGVNTKTVLERGGTLLTHYNGSLIKALNAVYGLSLKEYHRFKLQHSDKDDIKAQSSKSQRMLAQALKHLLPSARMETNYKCSGDMFHVKGKLRFIEFDVYFPFLQLAFEYQGETHYRNTSVFGSASQRQHNDALKSEFASSMGITLIPIPFWWDKSISSLAATVHHYRPDVVDHVPYEAARIPLQMPKKHDKQFVYTPNVVKDWPEEFDPTGWLMMKKEEGFRVYWDGNALQCKTLGASLVVPNGMLPSLPFEGILWMKNKSLHACAQWMKGNYGNWDNVKILAFDVPQAHDKPYTERLQLLRQGVPHDHSIVTIVAPIVCKNKDHLHRFLNSCNEQQANGVVLRKPNAWYFENDSFFTKKTLQDSVAFVVSPDVEMLIT